MKAIWTARCKSGYQILGSNGRYHTCNKACGRYQLLCTDCHSAVVIPEVVTESWFDRFVYTLKLNWDVFTLVAHLREVR